MAGGRDWSWKLRSWMGVGGKGWEQGTELEGGCYGTPRPATVGVVSSALCSPAMCPTWVGLSSFPPEVRALMGSFCLSHMASEKGMYVLLLTPDLMCIHVNGIGWDIPWHWGTCIPEGLCPNGF